MQKTIQQPEIISDLISYLTNNKNCERLNGDSIPIEFRQIIKDTLNVKESELYEINVEDIREWIEKLLNITSGADIIVQALVDHGVDTVFAYSGGAILPVFDAIERFNMENPEKAIKLIIPSNEQGAGFMAAGYARSTDKVGICIVTSGPGATNTITPVADSNKDSIPTITISGQVATHSIGTDAFQEAPIFNLMQSVTKDNTIATEAQELKTIMDDAFERALSGRPGAISIDLPKDVQNVYVEYKNSERSKSNKLNQKRTMEISENRISNEKFADLQKSLEASKRPLLYIGGGVIRSNASDALLEFCERLNLPMVTTLMGIGAINSKHRLNMGMLGMHGLASANYAVEDCDWMLAIGARFDDRVAGEPDKFAPHAKWIGHIDIDDSEIDKVKRTNWHHLGGAKSSIEMLLERFPKNGMNQRLDWHRHLAMLKKTHGMNYNQESDLIQPGFVMEVLNELKPKDSIISTGVGQHQMWAAQYLDIEGPNKFITSGSMGTMGFGLPAAIGAQFANPNKMVIDIDGDGSIRMNSGEIETLATHNIPVKILLLNNEGDGMVRQWQKTFFDKRYTGSDKTNHTKDFVASVKADGLKWAERVSVIKDVRSAMQKWIQFEGPSLLEVTIDREACVWPMVPPGVSYKNMITGPDIPARV